MSNKAGFLVQVTRLAPEAIKAHSLLNDLCSRYDLTPFAFTQRIRIDPGGESRARPVLTLGTGNVADPPLFLAEFLAQQIEWFLAGRNEAADRAAGALEGKFPHFYAQNPQLADRPTTLYRRLAAAWLEFEAMRRFFSEDEVDDVLRSHDEDRPVYRMMLRNRAAIADVMIEHGLVFG
jgi:hypothetical protein